MNAKTQVDTAGGELQRAPVTAKRAATTGKDAGDRATGATSPTAAKAAAEERLSVDPMRATDRYRLVVPFSLRV